MTTTSETSDLIRFHAFIDGVHYAYLGRAIDKRVQMVLGDEEVEMTPCNCEETS